jgi:hypothetical protein
LGAQLNGNNEGERWIAHKIDNGNDVQQIKIE